MNRRLALLVYLIIVAILAMSMMACVGLSDTSDCGYSEYPELCDHAETIEAAMTAAADNHATATARAGRD